MSLIFWLGPASNYSHCSSSISMTACRYSRHREPDPDWHFKFKGRIYCAGRPTATRLADLETELTSEAAPDSIYGELKLDALK